MKKFGRKWLIVLAMLVSCFVLFAGFGCGYEYESTTYTVTFMNGDDVFASAKYSYGDNAVFPEEEPTREADEKNSYTFIGWNSTGDAADPLVTAYQVRESMTFYAVYLAEKIDNSDLAEYLVTFRDSLTGLLIPGASQYVREGGVAVYPEHPDHTAEHWSAAEQPWSEPEGTIITSRMEIVALYERTVYPVYAYYLGKVTEVAEVAFGSAVELRSGVPNLDPAFDFEGWYSDAEYSAELGTPVVDEDLLTEGMVDGKTVTGVFVYAKYGLKVGAENPSLQLQGILTYGGNAFARVPNLTYPEGLVYRYAWDVTLNGEKLTSDKETFDLRDAGTYYLTCVVTADYLDGSLTASKTYRWYGSGTEEAAPVTVEKANLTVGVELQRTSVLYGEGAPLSLVRFSGFQYNDEEEFDVPITFRYTEAKGGDYEGTYGSADPVKLPVGSYTMRTEVAELNNYNVLVEGGAEQFPVLSFSVNRIPLTVTLSVPDHTYGEGFAPEPAFEGFVYGETAADLGAPTYSIGSGRTAEVGDFLDAGNYSVTAGGFASNNYDVDLTGATASFRVAVRPFRAITTASNITYGDAAVYGYDVEILGEGYAIDQARQSEELNVFTPVYVFTREGRAYTADSRFLAGSYTVRADLKGTSPNYAYQGTTETNFVVARKLLTVGIELDGSFTYGDKVEPKVSYEGFAPGENEQNITVPKGRLFTYQTAKGDIYSAVNGVYAVGAYTVLLDKSFSAENYTIEYENDAKSSFTVLKKTLKVTVELSKETLIYGEKPTAANGEGLVNGIRYDGFIEGESISGLLPGRLPVITYRDSRGETVSGTFHVGEYTATADLSFENYSVELEERPFSVTPKDVTVTLRFTNADRGGYTYGTVPTYTASYEGFLPGESDSYTRTAYAVYTGKAEDHVYTHPELTGSEAYIAVDEYTVTMTGFGEASAYSDYNITMREAVALSVTPKDLRVTLTASSGVYGNDPEVRVSFSGFAYRQSEELFSEDARTVHYYRTYSGKEEAYTLPSAENAHDPVGDYRATLENLQEETSNYTLHITEAKYTVSPRPINVTFTATSTSFTYGDYAKDAAYHGAPALAFTPDYEAHSANRGFATGEDASVLGENYLYTIQYDPELTGSNYRDYTDGGYFAAGRYLVTLSGPANINYAVSFPTPLNFTVAAKSVTVTVKATGWTYGDTPAEGTNYSYETEGIFEEDLKSFAFTHAFSRNGHAATEEHLPAGNNYSYTVNYTPNHNYRVNSITAANFVIARKDVLVSVVLNGEQADGKYSYIYGTAVTPSLAYSGLAAWDTTDMVHASNVRYTYLQDGETAQGNFRVGPDYAVRLESGSFRSDGDNYKFIQSEEAVSFAVTPLQITLGIELSDSFVYGQTPAPKLIVPTLPYGDNVSALGGEEFVFSSEKNGFGFYDAGSYTVKLKEGEHPNYTFTLPEASFEITPAALTVTLSAGSTYTYGDSQPAVSVAFSGEQASEKSAFEAAANGKIVFRRDGADYTAAGKTYFYAGSYEADLDQGGIREVAAGNYTITVVKTNFTVEKRNASVTVTAKGWTYGADNQRSVRPALATSGFAPGEDLFAISVSGKGGDVALDAEGYYDAGNYTVALNYAGAKELLANYNLTVDGKASDGSEQTYSFTVEKRTLTVTSDQQEYYWKKARDWKFDAAGLLSQLPSEIRDGFTFEGTLQLKDLGTSFEAKDYSYNGSDLSGDFEWSKQLKIMLGGKDVTENFTLSYTLKITLTDAKITINLNDPQRTYNGRDQMFGATVSFEEGEVAAYTLTYSYDGKSNVSEAPTFKDVFASKSVTVTVTEENGSEHTKQFDISITPKTLTFTDSHASKTYRGTPYEATDFFSVSGAENGETGDAVYTLEIKKGDVQSAIQNAGDYTVTLTANANYVFASDARIQDVTFTINKATYTVTTPENAGLTYNGEAQGEGITEVKGVNSETPEAAITYSCNGQEGASTVKTLNLVNAKTYTVSYTVAETENYEAKTGSFSVTIARAKYTVTAPENADLTYNGTAQGEGITFKGVNSEQPQADVTYSYGGQEQSTVAALNLVNATTYEVRYTVAETENYEKAEGSFSVTIAPKTLSPSAKTADTVYDGNANRLSEDTVRDALLGGVEGVVEGDKAGLFSFAVGYDKGGVAGFAGIKNAGTYTVTATCNNANYSFDAVTYTFTVRPADFTVSVTSREAQTYEAMDYFGSVLLKDGEVTPSTSVNGFDFAGLTIKYRLGEEGGFDSAVALKNANDYTVYYQITDGEGNFNTKEGSFTFTINKAAYTLSGNTAESYTDRFTYNGTEQNGRITVTAKGIGEDAGTVSKTASLSFAKQGASDVTTFKDAGTYTVSYTVAATENYEKATGSFEVTINKAQAGINTSDLQFGELKGEDGYTYSATYKGSAYTVDWSAAKPADTFNGTLTSEQIKVDGGSEFIIYKDGGYTVTLSITGTDNYEGATVTYTITINKRELSFVAKTADTVYNGAANRLSEETVRTALLSGVDDIIEGDEAGLFAFAVKNGEDTTNFAGIKDAGTYTVTATCNNANYSFEAVTYTFTVNKAKAEIDTSALQFGELEGSDTSYSATYKGSAYTVDWSAAKPADTFNGTLTSEQIKVDGGSEFTNYQDGGYTVTLSIEESDNYEGATVTYTITINKANYQVTEPTQKSFTYNGGLQGDPVEVKTLNGDPYTLAYGETGYQFKDYNKDGHVVTYTITGNENYYDVLNGSYTITIDPKELTVETLKESDIYSGGEFNATDFFSVSGAENSESGNVVYTFAITQGNQTIKNAGNYTITLTAGNNYAFEGKAPTKDVTFTIDKASYIMDGVEWNYTEPFTYTGSAHTVTLSELPQKLSTDTEGKQVTANYTGNSYINAGSNYTASVKFTYDTKNYNAPTVDDLTWVINKARLDKLPEGVEPPVIGEQINKLGKTLKDVALSAPFYWADGTTPLTLNSHEYNAYYNSDPANYENLAVKIEFTTRKEKITIMSVGTLEAKLDPDPAKVQENLQTLKEGLLVVEREFEEELTADELNLITMSIQDGVTYTIGSTYLATVQFSIGSNDYFELSKSEFDDVLVKIKSVQIGVRNLNNNNSWDVRSEWDNEENWYTIEEALHFAEANSDPLLETTIRILGNQNAAIETKFSALDRAVTGYSDDSYYTIKKGVALLLPVVDIDNQSTSGANRAYTSGTNEAYDGGLIVAGSLLVNMLGKNPSSPSKGYSDTLPANFNLATPMYSRLTVPKEVTIYIADGGTLTVGGITGAGTTGTLTGHLNRISGNYSELVLDGSIESEGTLNVYGNIVGEGTINAKRGMVRERFEVLDSPNLAGYLGRYLGNRNLSPKEIFSGDEYAPDNPNEFPVENYQLVAIGTKLTVHSEAEYVGNFRILIEGKSIAGLGNNVNAGVQFAVADFTVSHLFEGDPNANGVFLLREGATLTKTVQSTETGPRMKIEIAGGAVGGIASLLVRAFGMDIRANTMDVKFPISSTADIVLKQGEYVFEHGYEFMGPTSITFYNGRTVDSDPAKNQKAYKTTGSTLTLSDGAALTLHDTRDSEATADGIIFYDGSTLKVGSDCTLMVDGQFGGKIVGERGAVISFGSALAQAHGYIGGTGTFTLNPDVLMSGGGESIPVKFSGTITDAQAGGVLADGNGDLSASTKYYHNDSYWVGGGTKFTVTYRYYYRDAEGALQEITAGFTDESGNPTALSPDEGIVYLNYNNITYEGYTFVGWFADATCDQTINYVNGLELKEYTVYGLFEQIPVYKFSYDTNYNTLAEGAAVEPSGIEMNEVPVAKSQLNDFEHGTQITVYDHDTTKSRYFCGWYLKSGEEWLPYSAENVVQVYGELTDRDIEVRLYAMWEEKIHVVFEKDDSVGFGGVDAGYYRAGDVVSPAGYHNGNTDAQVETYFVEWQSGELKFAGSFTIPMEMTAGTELKFTAFRRQKVQIKFSDTEIDYQETVYYMAGSTVAPPDYLNHNSDASVPTYFVEWRSSTEEAFINSYTIPADTADGTVVEFTAYRAQKITVRFTDVVQKYDKEGSYAPGSFVEAPDYDNGNKDPNVQTYFIEWQYNGEKFEFVPEDAEQGTIYTLTAKRENKTKVTVTRQLLDDQGNATNKSVGKYLQLDITAVDPEGNDIVWIDDTDGSQTTGSKTGYFIPGTKLTVSLHYWKDSGTIEDDSCVAGSGWITVDGVKTSVADNNNQGVNGSHVPVNVQDSNISITFGATYVKGKGFCLAPGTLITLADGSQKPIENLVMGVDEILTFDHFTGHLTATSAYLLIYREAAEVPTVKLHFSNGTTVQVVEAHGFFDVGTNQYEIISVENVAQYVGHRFYSISGGMNNSTNEIVELVSYEMSTEYTECYSLFTSLYANHVANGMLAVTDDGEGLYNFFELDENMKYDEAKMQADIEKYGLFTYEEFAEYLTKEEFDMFNVQYLKVALGKGLVTMERIYHYFDVVAQYR